MEPRDLEPLLRDIESDRVERTVSPKDTDKFGEAVCAFANDLPQSRLPGYLFVGAQPNGSASGLTVTDQLLQNLAALRSDGNLLPPPVISVQKHALGGGEMAVVEVLPSDLPPVRYKGKVWIRVGPRRGVATEAEERILSERRQAAARSFDARPCLAATLEDLSLDLFTLAYRPRAIDRRVIEENHRPLNQQLASLRLFDERAGHPTNAGMLVLGLDNLSFYPGAYVQFVRYGGRDKGERILRERRIQGDLQKQLRGLDELAEELAGERPESTGLSERAVYDWPPTALHEIFVNALIHRSYESNSPVQINQFEDRIEVLTPGGLYDVLPEEFPELTGYRNPVLTEAARIYGFVNRFGRGIAKAQSELARNGSRPAEFDLRLNHVLARIWLRLPPNPAPYSR